MTLNDEAIDRINEGKCPVHNIRLVEGMCQGCYEDMKEQGRPKFELGYVKEEKYE